MKTQKKPIILVCGLVILFGAIAYLHNSDSQQGDAPPPPPPQTQPQDQKADVGKSVGNLMASSSKPSPMKQKMQQARGGPPGMGGPSILKPKAPPPMKQKPTDSSIGTQWWTKESGRSQATSN